MYLTVALVFIAFFLFLVYMIYGHTKPEEPATCELCDKVYTLCRCERDEAGYLCLTSEQKKIHINRKKKLKRCLDVPWWKNNRLFNRILRKAENC